MDLGVNPINGIASNVVNNKDQASTPLSTKTNNYINCDGNQNDDLDGKGKQFLFFFFDKFNYIKFLF